MFVENWSIGFWILVTNENYEIFSLEYKHDLQENTFWTTFISLEDRRIKILMKERDFGGKKQRKITKNEQN